MSTQLRLRGRWIPQQARRVPALLSTVLTRPLSPTSQLAVMSCASCELTAGPFSAAEAAHFAAVHDRLHHGAAAWQLPSGGH